MSLHTKLVLAFLLLAVVPLTGIAIYSYSSSIEVFRNAVKAESSALAEDMGGRMRSVRSDLASRMEQLGRFPFRQLMAMRGDKLDVQSSPLMAELMAAIGDSAAVESHDPKPAGAHARRRTVGPGGPGRPGARMTRSAGWRSHSTAPGLQSCSLVDDDEIR